MVISKFLKGSTVLDTQLFHALILNSAVKEDENGADARKPK
jgi:hypothetical protein